MLIDKIINILTEYLEIDIYDIDEDTVILNEYDFDEDSLEELADLITESLGVYVSADMIEKSSSVKNLADMIDDI